MLKTVSRVDSLNPGANNSGSGHGSQFIGYYLAVSALWGIPYLFVSIAVKELSVPVIVFTRVFIGALILIPLALKARALIVPRASLKYIALYAIFEMFIPWTLISDGQRSVSSGLAGLLIATVPIWANLLAALAGDRSVRHPRQAIGIVIGFIGVVALVGVDSLMQSHDLIAMLKILISAFSYAFATFMAVRHLNGISGVTVNGLAMALTAIVFLIPALQSAPTTMPSYRALFALLALGLLCTALAFYLFFTLLRMIGPPKASTVTYPNTAIAIALGVILLGEPITVGMVLGFPLVLLGSYLATSRTGQAVISTGEK
jgi:drug/metabolite transporter (DMT)-like permease